MLCTTGKDAAGKRVRGSVYKWLENELLQNLPLERAVQVAPWFTAMHVAIEELCCFACKSITRKCNFAVAL